MNDPKPSFLERAGAAIRRWASEHQRLTDDERYWQAAQNDPRLMADITCALARAETERPVVPNRRRTPGWSMPSPLVTRRHVVDH